MSRYRCQPLYFFGILMALLLSCGSISLMSMANHPDPSSGREQDVTISPTHDSAVLLAESVPQSPKIDALSEPQTVDNASSLPFSTIQSTTPPVQIEQIVGFGSIRLGATETAVRQQIERDELFDGITANNVSTNPNDDSVLLLATGTDHIDEAYFQFSSNTLVVITLFVDTDFLAYHTLLSSFIEKYGEPSLFSPSLVRWQSTDAQLELENPNIVKYADTRFLANRIESRQLQRNDRVQRNAAIIDLF